MSEQEFVKLTFVNRIAQAEELIRALKEQGIEATAREPPWMSIRNCCSGRGYHGAKG